MSQPRISTAARKPGRPRSEAARKAILQSAHEILMADGLGRLTVEAVAERAQDGKPTIYRYWRNAQELAMAALLADPPTARAPRRAASARKRLEAQMERVIEAFASVRGRQITLTMAAADQESELAKAFRTQIILKCREDGRAILIEAEAHGDVRLTADIEVVLDVIYAPIFYRLLAGHQPLSATFGREILETVFDGISLA